MPDRPPFFQYGDEDEDDAWKRGHHELYQMEQPDASESPRYRPGIGDVTYPCPSCELFRTEQRHIARRICSAVGAAAGATSAVAASLSCAETGAVIGALGGPIGAVCGGIAGAVLAELLAGAAGCTTGAALGEALDLKVLNNWRYFACGRTFTVYPD